MLTKEFLDRKFDFFEDLNTTEFTYDEQSQLKGVSNPEATTDYQSENFNYDSLGNRTNDQLGNYAYDQKKSRLLEDYKYFYNYDNNGNMTSRTQKGMTGTVTNYTYSSENQLIEANVYQTFVHTKTINYSFDALGRRTKKLIIDHLDSSKSFERKYAYDANERLAEYDEDDNILTVHTHSTLRTDDTLATQVTSEGVQAGIAQSSGSIFYLKDSLGSVTDIADSTGNLIQHYVYSSFGKILKITNDLEQDVTTNAIVKTDFAFTNRELDSETGFYYFRARIYNPALGRFLTEDPHPGKLGTPISSGNKYAYAGNNPVLNVDPNGKFFFASIVIGMVAGAIIAGVTGGDIAEGAYYGAIAGAALSAGFAVGSTAGAAAGAQASAILGTGYWGSIGSAIVAYGTAALAGAGVGVIAGGLVGGLMNEGLHRGSFEEGFITGGKLGYFAGGIGGIAGLGFGFGLGETPGTFGSFISGSPFLFAAPAAIVPFTGEFKVSCGEPGVGLLLGGGGCE